MTLTARYVDTLGIDEPLEELISGTASYYEQDGLGSVTSLSNSSGALVNTYSYDSYGKLLASTGTTPNPFQYTGREFDAETGAYYYRARYYDQNVGRFASEDPTRYRAGANFYRYALGSPVNFFDPFGFSAVSDAYSAFLNCVEQTVKQKLPANMASDVCKKFQDAGNQLVDQMANPNEQTAPETPTMGGLQGAYMDTLVDAYNDCLLEFPLAGLDPSFNFVDVGQVLEPSWDTTLTNLFNSVF